MPRLLAGGPGLGASLDHAWLAIASGERLELRHAATRELAASTILPIGDETDVVFVAGRLIAFTRQESATQARVFTLPNLEVLTQIELMGRARPVAVVNDRTLVTSEAGEQPRVLQLTTKMLASEPITLREPVQFAVAAPEERMLVAARDQLEAWDPMRRLALFRLNLPLNRPKLAGFAGRRRLLWIGSAALPGTIEVFRFSDGRMVLRIDLGQRLVAADGHPESPRLVVAVRKDDEPHASLLEYDLQLQERRKVEIEGDPVAAFCVVEGAQPSLVVAGATGEPRWLPLSMAMALEKNETTPRPSTSLTPPTRPAPPSRVAAAGSVAPTVGGASWRAKLGASAPGAGDELADAAPPVEARRDSVLEESRRAAVERLSGGRTSVARAVVTRTSGQAATTIQPPPLLDPPGDDEPSAPRVPERLPPARAAAGVDWRLALSDWAHAALAGAQRSPAPPVEESSPLGHAIARLALDPAAAVALALLYGAWLIGRGEDGLDAAAIARALRSTGAGPDEAWAEALDRGALARAGLTRRRDGRVRLRPVTTRFLDGDAPRGAITIAAEPPPAELAADAEGDTEGDAKKPEAARPTRGVYVLARNGEPLEDLPRALADHLGRGVMLVMLPSPTATPPTALVEARLHAAVPLIAAGSRPEWLAAVDALTVVVALDPDADLGDLPALSLG